MLPATEILCYLSHIRVTKIMNFRQEALLLSLFMIPDLFVVQDIHRISSDHHFLVSRNYTDGNL